MSRQDGKGVGIASADAPKTHDNEQRDFASDEGTGKAFATLHVELAMRGLGLHEITDRRYFWRGEHNYVRLDPESEVAHVFRLLRWSYREQDFDYFM